MLRISLFCKYVNIISAIYDECCERRHLAEHFDNRDILARV